MSEAQNASKKSKNTFKGCIYIFSSNIISTEYFLLNFYFERFKDRKIPLVLIVFLQPLLKF